MKAIYRVNLLTEGKNLWQKSFEQVRKEHLPVRIDLYRQIHISFSEKDESVMEIWKKTRDITEVSDVLVLNRFGEISCYYVNEDVPRRITGFIRLHLLAVGFFFGLGYGILQPLFQSFVTGTTPVQKRGVANATYMLSYDIGIGLGSLLMGFMQESVGLTREFALTAIAYVAGAVVYIAYVDRYYRRYLESAARQSITF